MLLLSVCRCLLCGVCCMSFVAWGMLFVGCCMLIVVSCMLFVICSVLYGV